MSAFQFSILVSVFLCGPATSAVATDEAESDTDLVERVLRDWRTRRNESTTANYMLTGRVLIVEGSLTDAPGSLRNKPIPPSDVQYDIRTEWTLDFVRGFVRKEMHESAHVIHLGEFRPHHEIMIFDGTELRSFRPRESNRSLFSSGVVPDVSIWEQRPELNRLCHLEDQPIFFAHGIPNMGESLKPDIAGTDLDAGFYSVHRKHERDDRDSNTIVLRTTGRHVSGHVVYEYSVDLSRDSAITGAALYDRNALSHQLYVDYQEVGPSHWVPLRWRVESYGGDGRVLRRVRHVEVERVALNDIIESSVFFQPLYDGYLVRKDGDYFRVRQDGHTMTRISTIDTERPSIARIVIALAVVASVVATAGVLGMMRRRERYAIQ